MKIEIWRGDITALGPKTLPAADAIVNAADHSLMGGGGVDGAIHAAAGAELDKECQKLNGCKTGEAKITCGYKLPAPYIIHTVGPVWGREDGAEESLLANCYANSLRVAATRLDIKSVAFPAISTGIFGYPKDKAAKIAIETIREYARTDPEKIQAVVLVAYDEPTFWIYRNILDNTPGGR